MDYEKYDGITGGEWIARDMGVVVSEMPESPGGAMLVARCSGSKEQPNAVAIAALPALLARCRALEGASERLRDAVRLECEAYGPLTPHTMTAYERLCITLDA